MSAVPAKAVRVIKARDECCVRCGGQDTDTHHRQRRAVGGHWVYNMIRLCRICHGYVHANPAAAREVGWIVGTWVKDPGAVPMQKWTGREFGLQWCRLDDDGLAWVMSPQEAGRRMRALGVTTETSEQ